MSQVELVGVDLLVLLLLELLVGLSLLLAHSHHITPPLPLQSELLQYPQRLLLVDIAHNQRCSTATVGSVLALHTVLLLPQGLSKLLVVTVRRDVVVVEWAERLQGLLRLLCRSAGRLGV